MIVKESGYETMIARVEYKEKNRQKIKGIYLFFKMLLEAKEIGSWVTNEDFSNKGLLRYAVHKDRLKKIYGIDIKVLDPIIKGSKTFRYTLGDNNV